MRGPRAPLFLKRRIYRRRRLRDAARMLPVVGLFLMLLPVLWADGGADRPSTASDGLFLFVVWAGLVLAAAAMAPGLAEETVVDDGAAEPGEDKPTPPRRMPGEG